MAASYLDAELRRGADATAQALVRDAREEADRIEAEADRGIEGKRAATLEHWEEEYRGEARAAIASARREATREVLLAKTRLIERVLERAGALLDSAMLEDGYQATLAGDLKRTLAFVGANGALIRCAPVIEAKVREAVSSIDGTRLKVDESVGSGFVVDEEGGVRVDATLESRLRRLAPQLSVEILQRIEESRE